MSTTIAGPPIDQSGNDSLNGRNQTVPAIPSPPVNGAGFSGDHSRKPSMTVTPAGTHYGTNGAQNKTTNIQFGSVNAGNGTHAMSTPQMAQQSMNNLGVGPINQRAASPSGSPSPIPQPASVSGGRPPSTFQGHGNGLSFGQMNADGSDPNGSVRPMSNMSFNPQQEHMRRSSSQSHHSEIGNTALPTGPGRGAYASSGRGRGNYYPNQMAYSPHQSFSPTQNGRGNGMRQQFQGRGQYIQQHQGSPNLGTRSPMMHAASPGTPQMGSMNMMPGMSNQQGYPVQYPQGYPTQADPSIQYMYANAYNQLPNQYYPNAGPPQSPRPMYQQPGYPHIQQYSQQGPPSMSRQSSQMSTATDRPGSSIGHTSTPAPLAATRTPSVSAPEQKPSFTLPKRSAAIVIKNANGEVVDFKKPTASTTVTPAAPVPAVSTPPSRTGSAADHVRLEAPNQTDEEKKKAFQDAVKAKQDREAAEKSVADKSQADKEAADQAAAEKSRADKEIAEKLAAEKAQMAEEAAEAEKAKAEAEKIKADAAHKEAELLEKKAQAAAQKKAEETETQDPTPVSEAVDDDEPDYDAIEAEFAAQEAEEARREEAYQKKKAAERENKAKKEQEDAAAYEANMKELERKAEEEELAREKKRTDGDAKDPAAQKMFAELKHTDPDSDTQADEDTNAEDTSADTPAETPADSGAVTPVSELMPPPTKNMPVGRKRLTDLTLDIQNLAEPPEPSATLKCLTNARRLADPTSISYPDGIISPNAALNADVPAARGFKYDKEFLLQFQNVFKEKPSLDWDTKIREALGDPDGSARSNTARTPSGMGPRNASRTSTAAMGLQPMGAFGGKSNLPPGTTSEQRFAAANSRGGPPNAFAFGRPPNMGPPTGRTPSNNPMAGMPGSPRAGGPSRGGRQESKRNTKGHKHEAEANKSMPLTAGLNIGGLETSSTGWKPRSLGPNANAGPTPGGETLMEPDVVQRKVKAALNKMTPEKFDRIADQVLEIAAQSKHETDGRTLRQVIQLTFEKATDEAHWASMYAMFCRKMLQSMSPDIKDENIKDKNGDVVTGGNLFRKYLLNRCQEEFERGWKINLPGKKEGETEEAVMLSDEYYIAAAAKRRGLGLVKFIGELFKLGMLTERIMHECVKKLVDYEGIPEEAEVESLTSLLRTIGKQLDNPESKAQGRMDIYFERIRQTVELPELNSRLKFMLMDIIDLRRKGWVSKADDKGPKTITEIREDAERAAQQAEINRLTQQAGRGGGGRLPMGRGDVRGFGGYGQAPPPDNSNRVGADDLRKLGGRSARNASNAGPQSLGPSLMGGRTNSGRRGLGPASFLNRAEDSQASSRTGTPPAQKDEKKKDESGTNAFSALAALEGQDEHEDPTSPPTQKAQPTAETASQASTT